MDIIRYGSPEGGKLIEKLLSRTQLDYGDVQEKVNEVIRNVRISGDKALFEYTLEFDHYPLNASNIRLSQAEIEEAYKSIDSEMVIIIKRAAARIQAFQEKQRQNSWLEPAQNGEIMGQMIRPMERVGVYVPGGKAAYPSSVLMNIIPAKIAGVKHIIMTTPPGKDGKVYPATVVAAVEAGADEIYKVGGAQAIAALAFGTETVPKVDKIVGPGNIYVALAKRSVFGYVGIDSVAGPSDILVIADDQANPDFVAADLLSQAEHDELASAVLITTNQCLADQVVKAIEAQTAKLERKEIINHSLANYGAIVIVDNLHQAAELSNRIAPEHLELCCQDPFQLLTKIQNAGAIFLGDYTPEPLGDYMAGPNHVLPTGGTARFFSPLSVDDFIKKSSVLSFSKQALYSLSEDIIKFANAEGFSAHANSVQIRMDATQE